MRYVTNYSIGYNTSNSNLSSFNRIKRSSLVGSDDAVETFKRQKNDEVNTTYLRKSQKVELYLAVDELVKLHIHILNLVEIPHKD